MKITFDPNANGGMGGFISWRRLFQQWRSNGELTRREGVIAIEVNEHGIKFTTKNVEIGEPPV